MIGGTDLVFQLRKPRESFERCLKALLPHWPSAVVECASMPGSLTLLKEAKPTAEREVFVYQDGDIARRWDELGAAPELANTMIQIIVEEHSLHFVVDDPNDAAVRAILADIRRVAGQDSLQMPAG